MKKIVNTGRKLRDANTRRESTMRRTCVLFVTTAKDGLVLRRYVNIRLSSSMHGACAFGATLGSTTIRSINKLQEEFTIDLR